MRPPPSGTWHEAHGLRRVAGVGEILVVLAVLELQVVDALVRSLPADCTSRTPSWQPAHVAGSG